MEDQDIHNNDITYFYLEINFCWRHLLSQLQLTEIENIKICTRR